MDLDPTLWSGLELGLKICPVKTSNMGDMAFFRYGGSKFKTGPKLGHFTVYHDLVDK